MDGIHKLAKWVDYNRGLAISLAIILSAAFVIGCESTTAILGEPNTRAEFQVATGAMRADIEADIVKYESLQAAGIAELDRKDKRKTGALLIISEAVSTYAPPALRDVLLPALALACGGIGAGAIVDNRRKDAKIKAATPPPQA